MKPSAVLQLCEYARQVERIQGVAPDQIHVVLGGQDTMSIRLAEVAAYHRAARKRFEAAMGATDEVYPVPVSHCTVCRWADHCADRRETDDHLSRVAGLTREQARKLRGRWCDGSTRELADAVPGGRVGIGSATLNRLHRQARLQVGRAPGVSPPFELIEPTDPGEGLAGLPEPDPGDLFYDIEGDPYVGEGGLEYLHGLGRIDDGEFAFNPHWAHDPAAERQAFEAVIDTIVERRARHPGMHVYHYAPYETTALGRLMGRYGTRESELDQLLRDKRLRRPVPGRAPGRRRGVALVLPEGAGTAVHAGSHR